MKELNLGLDIGTNSIGWALVDENGEIVRKNNFRFWGVRMFDEALTAKDRRTNRSSRRRLRRRRQRIEWLQDEFREEIEKVDVNFFQRLNDSFFKIEDKMHKNKYTFFDDDYTDQMYFKEHKTIYHLRHYLMTTTEKADIRMLYLAIHHIIKYRGHFLNEGEEFNPSDSQIVKEVFEQFNTELANYANSNEDEDEYFKEIDMNDSSFFEKLQEIMLEKSSKSEKENKIRKLMNVDKKTLVSEFLIKLLIYGKVKPESFTVVKDQKYKSKEIKLNDEEIQEAIDENKKIIGELSDIFDYVENIKMVVDYYYLLALLGVNNETKKNNQSLSAAMINLYNKHKEDLNKLKYLIGKYLHNKYKECFRIYDKKINNYVSYVGKLSTGGKTTRFAHCKKEDFETYIKKLLNEIKEKIKEIKDDEKVDEDNKTIDEILTKIENNEYMPIQNSGQNTTIPMQLNLNELKIILANQAKHYPFLNEIKENKTTIERIISIFEYHIPYYVGPLSNVNNNQFSWIERKPGQIRPWNFDDLVDKEASAKRFIERMQNKCTYLKGPTDYCLPKMSLLFTEYNCLQYLNKLRIDGVLISKEFKEKIFNEFFLNKDNTNPTRKKLTDFIYKETGKECTGIPEINCNMSSYIKMKEIFGDEFEKRKDDGTIEEIIKDITIFEDKNLLTKRFKDLYHLSDEQIKKLKGLNYKGYGALCRRLLDELRCENEMTGEVSPTIIELLRDTNMNLQEIIFSNEYPFQKAIDDYNKNLNRTDKMDFRTFIDENLYVSPMMKRALIQSYKLIEEIERIFKRPINKYYIECSRSNQQKKERTISRYQKLVDLYKKCREDAEKLNLSYSELNKLEEELEHNKDKLSVESIYLYFTQLGKCVYTLNPINLDDIIRGVYDIDHIYPQSLVKDDSFSNIVLVNKVYNQSKKGNKFLCDTTIRTEKHYAFYDLLSKMNLITKEKYRRLTEKEVDDSILDGFVNRQLVSTNQAVKGVITLLKLFKNVKTTDIIYSKAENVSDFRKEFDFLKSRTANNFHHAHDAYLNVVIGRAIHTYYEVNRLLTSSDVKKIQNEQKTLNPNKVLKRKIYDLKGNLVWDISLYKSKIEKYLYHVFDIHETTKTCISNKLLSKVTICPAGEGTVLIKSSVDKMAIEKYGGITSYAYCKYCIVETINKKEKKEYFLEAIPTAYKDKVNDYIAEIYSSELYLKKYNSFSIINDSIPTNVIITNGRLKYMITGKSDDSYLIQNASDRRFSKNAIRIIRAIDKYNEQVKFKTEKEEIDKKIIVSPSKKLKNGEITKEIAITKDDCLMLIQEIKELYSKDIFSFSPIITLVNTLNEINDFSPYNISELIKIISQMLLLLKTNERKIVDLLLIKLAKNFGKITIGKKLKEGIKFIAESITGYFTEVIFEVTSGI